MSSPLPPDRARQASPSSRLTDAPSLATPSEPPPTPLDQQRPGGSSGDDECDVGGGPAIHGAQRLRRRRVEEAADAANQKKKSARWPAQACTRPTSAQSLPLRAPASPLSPTLAGASNLLAELQLHNQRRKGGAGGRQESPRERQGARRRCCSGGHASSSSGRDGLCAGEGRTGAGGGGIAMSSAVPPTQGLSTPSRAPSRASASCSRSAAPRAAPARPAPPS